jgi:hypothetical protein
MLSDDELRAIAGTEPPVLVDGNHTVTVMRPINMMDIHRD